MKLISMTDFVLQKVESKTMKLSRIADYANFLSQPLTLGMFVPCDDDGNVMEDISGHGLITNYSKKVKCFQDAKSKVLFNGFSYINEVLINNKNHCSINKYDLNRLCIEFLIVYDLDCTVSF